MRTIQWGWVVTAVLFIVIGLVLLSLSMFQLGYNNGFYEGRRNTTIECVNLIEKECPDLWNKIMIIRQIKLPPEKLVLT